MFRRLIDWLIGRTEPDEKRLRDNERRLEILTARLEIRRHR